MKGLSGLFVLCLGLSGSVFAGSMDNPDYRLPSTPGHYGGFRTSQEVLVVRDYLPWGGDVVPYFTNQSVNVTVIGANGLRTADLSGYCLVYVTGAQTENNDPTSLSLNSLAARTNLANFATAGGAVLYTTGTFGSTLRLPGGVNSAPGVQSVNFFTGVNPLSNGMPFPEFAGSEASHDSLMNLPAGALTYITEQEGHATAVDYPVGAGRVLALTQPLEYYLGEGASLHPHMVTLLQNAIAYGLSVGQCEGQVFPGELSLDMDAISSFACTGTTYEPATGDLHLTLTNVGGAPCDGINAILVPGTGLQVVGDDQLGTALLLPGESASLTFQVAPLGNPCDAFLHYDLLISCSTCSTVAGSGQIWVPCCGVVDAMDQPLAFALKGNHPNPFNPVTTIAYSLPATGAVTLSVFSLTGELVATLVDGAQSAGEHQVVFDGSHLSSGLYLYRLESQGQSLTARMMLIK
jgi:hypothetical protein